MAKIIGVHAMLFSKSVKATRAFFRDVLGFPHVDAGGGWLIFCLPPAELGVHPAGKHRRHELYLMCDDLASTAERLKRKGVKLARRIEDAGWGLVSGIKVPGVGEIALYEPRHPVAIGTARKSARRAPRKRSRRRTVMKAKS